MTYIFNTFVGTRSTKTSQIVQFEQEAHSNDEAYRNLKKRLSVEYPSKDYAIMICPHAVNMRTYNRKNIRKKF